MYRIGRDLRVWEKGIEDGEGATPLTSEEQAYTQTHTR
jgi:hypothetical protein